MKNELIVLLLWQIALKIRQGIFKIKNQTFLFFNILNQQAFT